jgi:hypothetical protein
MNIAYLILAHNQPLQLERLIERLNQPNINFYVHVDKKSKDLSSVTQNLSKYKNVTVISRYNVNWMGFNMVKSTLDLIQHALASGINFKYYVLLSGQDYPIKNNEYVNNFFSSHNTDFISYNKLSHLPEPFRDKVRLFHFPDIPYTNPRSLKKIPILVKAYYGIYKRFKKYMPQRSFYKNYEPYFGSQWFALTHETIKYVLEFIKENKQYVKFMELTEGPDEIFFQTIILNSERKNNLCGYDSYLDWLKTRKDGELFVQGYSSLRYMDWSERGKPKPAVLDSSYYETLKESEELFARKFDEVISADLLRRIDINLLGIKM